jgi:hypothetical protein
MTVAELQTLLNLYPENLEIVVLGYPHEFRKPFIKAISVISSTEGIDKYFFENNGEMVEGEKLEEVLLIN